MLGLALISIGNLLPKMRPNLAIGIRTTRTLADRALWNRVHRAAGYLTVASGFVLVLSALTVPRPLGPGMILVVGPAALVGTCLVIWFPNGRWSSRMAIIDGPLLSVPERVPAFDVRTWVLRIAAAGLFLAVGPTKFRSSSLWVGMFADTASATGFAMAGAILTHLFVLDTAFGGAIIPLALLGFVVFVATSRAS